jgi:hypothetical protein
MMSIIQLILIHILDKHSHFNNAWDLRPTPGELSAENKRIPSTTLYYPYVPFNAMSNKVKWLHNSIDGPYAGKYDQLTKYTIHQASR